MRKFWRFMNTFFRSLWKTVKKSEITQEMIELIRDIGEEVWDDINLNPAKYFAELIELATDGKVEREDKIKAWFKEVRTRVEDRMNTDPEFDKVKNIAEIINIVYAIIAASKKD